MVESTIEPKSIEIDTIKRGKVNILVHWNIEQIEREGQMLYKYEECRMDWILPKAYTTKAGITSYLNSIGDEILDWAKGSKVTL